MTWLWLSYAEYKDSISPIYADDPNMYRITTTNSWFENLNQMFIVHESFNDHLNELRRMGFYKRPPYKNKKLPPDIQGVIWNVIHFGEFFLLYNKRLAHSRWASNFLYTKEVAKLLANQDTEIKERDFSIIHDLYMAGEKLLEGHHEFKTEDDNFLIEDLRNVYSRKDLMLDFVLARNLFSIGIDGIGAFVASRGFEGILREVAKRKGLTLKLQNGKTMLGSEASFHDLIELCYRARWRKDKRRLIKEETKHLLHYLRTTRNYSAHPSSQASDPSENRNWRSVATLVAETANSVWGDAQRERAQLISKEIPKEW